MKLSLGLPYRLLVAGSVAWLSIVFLAPWARQQGWVVADLLYAFFAPVCHQNPDRSLFCFAHPLTVCHRCLGLYCGFTLGLLTMPWLDRLRELLLRWPRLALLFAVPMAIDVFVLPYVFRLANTPTTRVTSGILAAFPVSLFVWAAGEQIRRSYFRSTPGDPTCIPNPTSSNPL